MTVTLSQEQWNNILMLLAEQPYKISAPLIQAIAQQLQQPQEPRNNIIPMSQPGE